MKDHLKSLPITWQRLVTSDGSTCDRCNATHQEIQQAISKLKEALRPLGIEPALEIRDIDEASFKANPSESNRIWSEVDPWSNGLVRESDAVVAVLFVANQSVER